jgi:regulator of telomere elongation helicase 1
MKNLYNCLETCEGGLFESPTDTGKTLSIICASLSFLSDHINTLGLDPTSPIKNQAKLEPRKSSEMNSQSQNPELKPRILYISRTHSQLDQHQ